MTNTRPIFRVFFASTFPDFVAERDALQTRVFPKLKQHCRNRGASFLPIDLRWGVSNAAKDSQLTVSICLNEIHRCQKTSPGFNFVALVGDRYGSRLLPDTIPRDDLDKLLEALPANDQALVRRWYLLDTNRVPAHYVLGSRVSDPPGWHRDGAKLQNLLVSASQQTEINEGTRLSLCTSVIEQEIHAGTLEVEPEETAICFMRRIKSCPVTERHPQFFDVGRDERQRLADLKRRLAEHMPKRVIPYDASWGDGQLNADYLNHFCHVAELHLKARIDDALEVWGGSAAQADRDDLLRWDFARNRLGAFTGRDAELRSLAKYVSSPLQVPLVVSGAPGSGKTTLLLRAAVQARLQYPDALHLHYFVGGNIPISNVDALLRSLIDRLLDSYAHPGSIAIPDDPFALEMTLPNYLGLATPDRPLVVYVDVLNLLSRL